MANPKLTLIIPVRPNAPPPRALSSLEDRGPSQHLVETLIPEGNSPSLQRNTAAREAKGEYLYFLDDDCSCITEALEIGVRVLDENPQISLVGGPAVTRPEANILESALGEAMSSTMGSIITKSRHTPIGKARIACAEEFTLCNLMIRKSVYLDSAGLNNTLYPGEDPEFLKRLTKSANLCLYRPDMIVNRSRRQSFSTFALQFFRYGCGRARHILNGIRPIDLFFFIPTFFIIGLILLLFYPLWPIAAFCLLYFAMCLITACVHAIQKKRLAFVFLIPLALFVMHCSYGIGFALTLLPIIGERARKLINLVKKSTLS